MKFLHRNICIYILTICTVVTAAAQHLDTSRWISYLNDSTPVAQLSIPGAHNAATGEGFCFNAGFGKTQSLSLSKLWDCGIRFFDLRPAVDGNTLHIYHGPLKTIIPFNDALSLICNKLEQYPEEFAIVLLREENKSKAQLWAQLVGEAIETLGDKAAHFSPGMTVGETRGKILFISRNAYTGCNKGAFATGWSHTKEGNSNAQLTSFSDGCKARLQIQDYYDTTNKKKLEAKQNAVHRFIEAAGHSSTDTWTINFLSAYSTTWLKATSFATTAGYKRNADTINRMVADILENRAKDKCSSTGILVMDFAGVDKASGELWHWHTFDTHGNRLTRLIIEQNFR